MFHMSEEMGPNQVLVTLESESVTYLSRGKLCALLRY